MKKKIFVIALLLIEFLSLSSVHAATTEYIVGPSIVPGAETVKMRGSRRSLTGSTQTAQGKNCGLRVTVGGSISQYLAAWSNRVLTLGLWEYDNTGGDDHIKYYKGTFSGRTLVGFELGGTLISGDVESSNDPTAELYISYYLTKNSEDTKDKGTNDFFKYRLENN